jgi:cell division protein FtsQ
LNTKIKYKKLLHLFAWLFALAGLFTSWSFSMKKQNNTPVSNINIYITNPSENDFIDELDVQAFFQESGERFKNKNVSSINLFQLEKSLNTHPAVENAELAYDVNGSLKILVKQRRPMLRVFNRSGESYYIDSTGRIMPLSYKSTSRVMVANGFLNEPFARRYQFSIQDINANKNLKAITLLDNLYEITEKLYADSCLKSLIHQIYVDQNGEFILIPTVGMQHILLGKSSDDLSQKLNKLKLFYLEGLNKTDSWNKYSSINLKYKNIVVCTKI